MGFTQYGGGVLTRALPFRKIYRDLYEKKDSSIGRTPDKKSGSEGSSPSIFFYFRIFYICFNGTNDLFERRKGMDIKIRSRFAKKFVCWIIKKVVKNKFGIKVNFKFADGTTPNITTDEKGISHISVD